GDRFSDVTDAVSSEQRPVPLACLRTRGAGDELRRILDVGATDDEGDAGDDARCGRVDVQDSGVAERTADEGDVEHPRQADVVEEAAAAPQELRVLDPLEAAPDVPERPAQDRSSASSRAASRTEATMPV